jgi:hypothetical protein
MSHDMMRRNLRTHLEIKNIWLKCSDYDKKPINNGYSFSFFLIFKGFSLVRVHQNMYYELKALTLAIYQLILGILYTLRIKQNIYIYIYI